MANSISKIKIPSGTVYEVKDDTSRGGITDLRSKIDNLNSVVGASIERREGSATSTYGGTVTILSGIRLKVNGAYKMTATLNRSISDQPVVVELKKPDGTVYQSVTIPVGETTTEPTMFVHIGNADLENCYVTFRNPSGLVNILTCTVVIDTATAKPVDNISKKLDKPSTEGTAGQVVASDGNGGTEWVDMVQVTADVTDLPEGSSATVTSELVSGVPKLTFGIPAGATGRQGDKGERGDTVVIAKDYADLTFPVYAGKTYCYYDNKPYVANTDIATTEAWTAAHWDEVSFEDEISDLKSAIDEKADKSDTPKITDSEESEADLYLCDPAGNVLAKFEDGHIITKYFTSKSIGNLANLSTETKTDLVNAINEAAQTGSGSSDIIMDTTATDADLYVCDGFGNVLVKFKNGGIITKNFNSEKIDSKAEKELDLEAYEQVSYNIENGSTWTYSTTYKGILIPAKDLSYTNKFYSDTYKLRFAFLRSFNITPNTAPDYCLGTGLVTLTAGLSKYYELPSDCTFVYVYVSDGTYFGQMGILRMGDVFSLNAAIRNSEKPAFVTNVAQSLLTAKHMNTGVLHDFVASNVSDNLLTIAHISDLHNDPTNYTSFLNLLNEHDSIIDVGIVSGDLVDSGSNANFAEMIGCESVLNGNVPVYKCVGNHETGMSLANIYTAYQPGSGDGSLYFSKDFSTQKIRIIFLNQYDNETSTRGNTGHYSQAQIDWFIAQLQDAITNDLSVIVVLHSMGEAGWAIYNKQGFYQQVLGPMYPAVNSGPIISDIINAYKHRGSVEQTYTYTDGEGSLSVSVVFEGYGKFVCYIAGHEHVDAIGYSPIYPDQLICLVQGGVVTSTTRTEAQAHWQSKYDTPRVANTVTSDSINVYSIDTAERLVKVVKVGSTITDKFETRSFAVFGY